jgi:hypothetical protein
MGAVERRTDIETDARLNSSPRQPASDPRSQTAEPQNNRCDVAASCPHSIFATRLECCADQLSPPHKAAVRKHHPVTNTFCCCRVIRIVRIAGDLASVYGPHLNDIEVAVFWPKIALFARGTPSSAAQSLPSPTALIDSYTNCLYRNSVTY